MSFWSLLNWVFILRTRHTRSLTHSLTQSANSTFGPFAVAVAISQQLNSFYSQSAAAAATTNVCIYININWFCPCDKLETCSILHLRRCPIPRSVPRLVAYPSLQRSIQSGLGPSFFLSDDSLSLGQFYLLVRTFSVCSLRLLIWFLSSFYFLPSLAGNQAYTSL